MAAEPGAQQRTPRLPAAIAVLDGVLLITAVGIWASRRVPLDVLADSYLLGNACIGAGFAAGGALVTLRARRNAVGWLMLLGGTLYLLAAAAGSVLYLRLVDGHPGGASRVLALVFVHVWMPAVALLIPLAVQLFPTGRPVNRFWRGYLAVSVAGGLAATAAWLLQPGPLGIPGLADQRPLVTGVPGWAATAVGVASLGGLFAAGSLLAPLHRLVRRHGEERLQVLWLVWAVAVVLLANVPGALADVPEPLPLLTVPLIPLAMTAAILRHRLYGITLVLNRTAVYLLLTAGLLAGYLAVVYGLGTLVPSTGVRQVLATGAVAVAFSPLRARLQRGVDRLMYGSGADPYGVLADLGARLQSPMTPDQVLPAIANTLAGALRLSYVQVRAGRPGAEPLCTAEHGTPDGGPTGTVPLTHRGEEVGALVVGTAGRPRGLPGPRRTLLADLARHAGPAVHSVVLTEELAASRQRTIAALEEERTRIRRDLHDGLGPTLTGVLLKAEAAGNLLAPDGGRAAELVADVGAQTRAAIDDVRRLVYDLRPPALDRLGLRPALEGYVDRLGAAVPDGRPALGLDLPGDLPRMAPAVEVAAYRIVTEALANVVRHSGALSARARLWVEDRALHLEVRDDGTTADRWVPGVGLTSMRERAEQLGGGFAAAGTPAGGTVVAWLPLTSGEPAPVGTAP